MDKPLGVEVLLAWGRDWQRHLEAEATPGRSFHVPTAVLKQYLERANVGLALLKQHEARGRSGRPPGTGMGAKAASLITCGVREDDAVRMVADHHKKPIDKVRDALRRDRAQQSKKTS